MRIVSRVAAAFYRRDHTPIFEVNARDLLVILDAPDELKSDPLFGMLVKEGSLQVINSEETQKLVELDPKQGTNAEGRKMTTPEPEAVPDETAAQETTAPAKKTAAKSK